MENDVKKRLYSLAWRVGMMTLVILCDAIIANATTLNIHPMVVIFAGLVAGEVSKYLNTK
jgi:hypothetical protein